MDEHEIKRYIAEQMHSGTQLNGGTQTGFKQTVKKKKMEFIKKLLVFSCTLYGCTWAAGIGAWFLLDTYPSGLLELATWLFGAILAFYCAKSCIENKAKIENSHNYD